MDRRIAFYGLSAVAGAVLVLVLLDGGPPVIFLAALAALAVVNVRRASLLLRVDEAGLHLGRGFAQQYGRTVVRSTSVPWPSVASLRVVRSPGADEALEVRLRPDAPLPDGVRGIVRTPGEPEVAAPELRVALPAGSLDRDALVAAVAAFGGGVPVHDAA